MGNLLAAIDSWDRAVVNLLQNDLGNQALRAVMEALSSFPLWMVPLLLAWLALLVFGGPRGRAAAVLIMPLLLLSDVGTAKVLKPLFGRPRPLGHGGLAFPSVHAANSFAVAALVWHFFRNLPLRIATVCLAGAIAFSRVYIGVHYPSDVVAGALVGIADAAIVIGLYYLLRPTLERHAPLLFPSTLSSD